MKPRDSIALATDPFGVVRHASWKSTIKERLTKISNVNHDGTPASDPEVTQLRADLPRNFKIKFRPDQFGFLKLNLFEIAVKIHGREVGEVIGEKRDVGWVQDIGSTIVGRLSSTPPTWELLDDRSI